MSGKMANTHLRRWAREPAQRCEGSSNCGWAYECCHPVQSQRAWNYGSQAGSLCCASTTTSINQRKVAGLAGTDYKLCGASRRTTADRLRRAAASVPYILCYFEAGTGRTDCDCVADEIMQRLLEIWLRMRRTDMLTSSTADQQSALATVRL